jgi:hypothetical protein
MKLAASSCSAIAGSGDAGTEPGRESQMELGGDNTSVGKSLGGGSESNKLEEEEEADDEVCLWNESMDALQASARVHAHFCACVCSCDFGRRRCRAHLYNLLQPQPSPIPFPGLPSNYKHPQSNWIVGMGWVHRVQQPADLGRISDRRVVMPPAGGAGPLALERGLP